jgi:hypothetical protein
MQSKDKSNSPSQHGADESAEHHPQQVEQGTALARATRPFISRVVGFGGFRFSRKAV